MTSWQVHSPKRAVHWCQGFTEDRCIQFAQVNGVAETFSQATLGGSQRLHAGEQKVLGVNWNVSSDQIIFSLEELADQARSLEPTKRNVISLIGRFYDRLGFLAPIVVRYNWCQLCWNLNPLGCQDATLME